MRKYVGKAKTGVPRPAYREVRVQPEQANDPAVFKGGFLDDGLILKTLIGGVYNTQAYYDPKTKRYSGVAIVQSESGKELEVSVNGLGENKAELKIRRAIVQYCHYADERLQKGYCLSGQKRAERKARVRSRHKQPEIQSWRPSPTSLANRW